MTLASKIGWAENLGENHRMQYDYRKLVQKQHFCTCCNSDLGGLVINIVVPLREFTASTVPSHLCRLRSFILPVIRRGVFH